MPSGVTISDIPIGCTARIVAIVVFHKMAAEDPVRTVGAVIFF